MEIFNNVLDGKCHIQKSDKEKVAIIVPIYNIENYISRCIESLIKQTYKNICIYLINDGSTDKSKKIVENYAQIDNRIIVISKENGGLSDARNAGLNNMNPDIKWVMFVDGDDWLDKRCIECCLNNNGRIENPDLVFFPYIKEYDNYSEPVILFKEPLDFSQEEVKEKLFMRLIGPIGTECNYPQNVNNLSTAWGKLYKKDIIGEWRFLDIKYSEDTFFNIHIFSKIKRARYIDEISYHYNKSNPEAITKGFNNDLVSWKQKLYILMKKYLKESGIWLECKQHLENRLVTEMFGLCLAISNANSSYAEKKKEMKHLLQVKYLKKALEAFDCSYLLLRWKIFFYACKKERVSFILVSINLIKTARCIIKRGI